MEDSVTKMESLSYSPGWKKAVDELIRGRDSATMLEALMKKDQPTGSAKRVLVEQILSSISRALLVLDSGAKSPGSSAASGGSTDDRSCESSGTTRRSLVPGRRSYKKRSHPYASWTRITSRTLADDYAWRKYGQKVIYSSPYPRSYFRCTHKHDRGCQATRQVQQSKDDPTMFVITYMGDHTCRNQPTKDIASNEVASNEGKSYLISFGSGGQSETPLEATIAYVFPPPEQDTNEEVLSSSIPDMNSSMSEEDFLLPELRDFGTSTAPLMEEVIGPAETNHEDMTSGFNFYQDLLDLDFMGCEFENLDDFLNFDHAELS